VEATVNYSAMMFRCAAHSCLPVCAVALMLSGCLPSAGQMRSGATQNIDRVLGTSTASFSDDNARNEFISKQLAAPLTVASVAAIALANNAHMAIAFDDLNIASADVAMMLAAPSIDIDLTAHGKVSDPEFDAEILVDVIALINRAAHSNLASASARMAQANATESAVRLVSAAQRAFWSVVAAQQQLLLRQQSFETADISAEIRTRMFQAGNSSELAYARELDQREQAKLDLGRAQLAVEYARESLNTALGISGKQAKWTVTETIAALAATAPNLDDLEQKAVDANLRLTSLRAQSEVADEQAGIARTRQWIPELAAGVALVGHGNGAGVAVGPALRIGLPWFGSAGAIADRKNAEVIRTKHELTATSTQLRGQARNMRSKALALYAEATHLQNVIIPLREKIVEQTLLHYNAMDADPFELMIAQRQLTEGRIQLLQAQLQFVLEQTAIATLLQGAISSSDMQSNTAASTSPTARVHD
jgi:outer membrane protein, heavy metal efflux system